MVRNVGMDNSGEHGIDSPIYKVELLAESINVTKIKLRQSTKVRKAMERLYRNKKRTIYQRVQLYKHILKIYFSPKRFI